MQNTKELINTLFYNGGKGNLFDDHTFSFDHDIIITYQNNFRMTRLNKIFLLELHPEIR